MRNGMVLALIGGAAIAALAFSGGSKKPVTAKTPQPNTGAGLRPNQNGRPAVNGANGKAHAPALDGLGAALAAGYPATEGQG